RSSIGQAPVEAGFLPDVRARLRESSSSRAGHVLQIELFNCDQTEVVRDPRRYLMEVSSSRIPRFALQSRQLCSNLLPASRAALTARKSSSSAPEFFRSLAARADVLNPGAVGKRCQRLQTHIDTDLVPGCRCLAAASTATVRATRQCRPSLVKTADLIAAPSGSWRCIFRARPPTRPPLKNNFWPFRRNPSFWWNPKLAQRPTPRKRGNPAFTFRTFARLKNAFIASSRRFRVHFDTL